MVDEKKFGIETPPVTACATGTPKAAVEAVPATVDGAKASAPVPQVAPIVPAETKPAAEVAAACEKK